MSEDVDDPLDFLGGAEPVTSDGEDTVTSEVGNTEADRIRSSTGTDGADLKASDDEPEHEEPLSKFVAECRWCRVGFESEEDAGSHEDCSKEPVSACGPLSESLYRNYCLLTCSGECAEYRAPILHAFFSTSPITAGGPPRTI